MTVDAHVIQHACGHLCNWIWDPLVPDPPTVADRLAGFPCPWCGGESGDPIEPVDGQLPDYYEFPGLAVVTGLRLPTEEEVLRADPR